MVLQKKIERTVYIFLILTFFVGLWHGFPFTNVVADEGFFSGSVLRALDARSLFPLPLDVPYGTITYYISYGVVSVGLAVLLVFFSFDVSALKLFITLNPYVVYGFARIVSFIIALGCLWLMNKALTRYVSDYKVRVVLLVSLFGTLLVNVLFHTSKVWILSTALLLGSLYCLVRVLENRDVEIAEGENGELTSQQKKLITFTLVMAFLSFANFPFMGLSLISLLVILYYFWPNKKYRKSIIIAVFVGISLFLLIVGSNFSGVKAQVYSIIFDYSFSEGAKLYNVSVLTSAFLHGKKIIFMFPVLLTLLAYGAFYGKIRHKRLFFISLLYCMVYVALIIVVDRWSTTDKAALRYLFPLPFLLTLLIASFDYAWRKILLIPCIATLIYIFPTLYFLSIPTTSHEAVSFVYEYFKDKPEAVIINYVGADTPIPQNKKSFLLSKPQECGSRCKATVERDLGSEFKAYALDAHTDPRKLKSVIEGRDVYHVERAISTSSAVSLVTSFTNPIADLNYYSADNTGSYFDLDYFKITRYGPNIYIYKQE